MTRTAALASSWRNAMAGLSALLLALLVVLGTPRPAGAEAAADAAEFVRDFSGRAIAVLADEGLSADRREEEFRRLLVAGVDVEVIGRFVLGPHWRKATDEQRAEFRRLFEAL
ncbi:MAG: ABC transporter substrate-binding protein, partial [Kiloniellaceae bacterium]